MKRVGQLNRKEGKLMTREESRTAEQREGKLMSGEERRTAEQIRRKAGGM